MIPTMRDASRPSRSPMTKVGSTVLEPLERGPGPLPAARRQILSAGSDSHKFVPELYRAGGPRGRVGPGGYDTDDGPLRRCRRATPPLPAGRSQPRLPRLLRAAAHAGHQDRPGHQRRLRVHLDADQAPHRGAPRSDRGGLRLGRSHRTPRQGRRVQGRAPRDARRLQAPAGPDRGGPRHTAHPGPARERRARGRRLPRDARRARGRRGPRGHHRHGGPRLLPARAPRHPRDVQPQRDQRHRGVRRGRRGGEVRHPAGEVPRLRGARRATPATTSPGCPAWGRRRPPSSCRPTDPSRR